MTPRTIGGFLIGRRDAIERLASHPWTPVVALLFVLSAGLAREYDGEDLWREPWHAFRSLGASLASGTALFVVVVVGMAMAGAGSPNGLLRRWWSFMGLFWMTAPMAWAYAIPYERWMSPVDAIRANLWTLAIVAIWRVVLMIRVLRVLCGLGLASFFLVILFADVVVLFVASMVPMPVIDVMGGIRSDERENLISGTVFLLATLAVLSSPVLIVGAIVTLGQAKPDWWALDVERKGVPIGALLAASGALLILTIMAALVHREQGLRWRVERLASEGRLVDAMAIMAAYERSEFPPHWQARVLFESESGDADRVVEAIESTPPGWGVDAAIDHLELECMSRLRVPRMTVARGWSWTLFLSELKQVARWNGESLESIVESLPDPPAPRVMRCIRTFGGLTDSDRASLDVLIETLERPGS